MTRRILLLVLVLSLPVLLATAAQNLSAVTDPPELPSEPAPVTLHPSGAGPTSEETP